MNYIDIYCTIIFIDLVDSSIYSKILKTKNYAELLELFQETAKRVYQSFYDKYHKNDSKNWFSEPSEVRPRGDEAVIFFTTDMSLENNAYDIELAVKFALQVKFEWKKVLIESGKYETKSHVDLAVGINRGLVSGITDEDMNIIKIEGYEINYAKRVESSSRLGENTNIFLSEKARNLIKSANIVFKKYENCNLKGLEERTTLYEVDEFIFDDLPYSYDSTMKNLIEKKMSKEIAGNKKQWLEQYIISIFYSEFSKKVNIQYKEYILDWIEKSVFIDKIFYRYLKASLLDDDKYFLLKLKYFQDIIKDEPTFIAPRLELIELYRKHESKLTALDPIKFQIKNYIDEMFNFYPDIINPEEKVTYNAILDKINQSIPENE